MCILSFKKTLKKESVGRSQSEMMAVAYFHGIRILVKINLDISFWFIRSTLAHLKNNGFSKAEKAMQAKMRCSNIFASSIQLALKCVNTFRFFIAEFTIASYTYVSECSKSPAVSKTRTSSRILCSLKK